jgi:tetratricopeptide (TPR) repeat protein
MKLDPVFEDPLREARRAVQDGRFREAVDRLGGVPDRGEATPEWLLLMAMARWRLGDFSESHTLADRARLEYRDRGDTDGEMRAQNVAAAGAFARGHLVEAREGFERASDLARQLADTLMLARCTNNMGNVLFHLGANPDALVLYANATNLFEHSRSLRGIAEAWHNIGTVLREEGDLAGGREATDRAVDAAEGLGDKRLLGQTLAGRGETDALLGDLPLARVGVTKALQLAREHDDRLTECHALRVLGIIAREEGQYGDAVQHGTEAMKLALDVGNQWMVAKAREELAETLLDSDQVDEARATLAAAAACYDRIGSQMRATRLLDRLQGLPADR